MLLYWGVFTVGFLFGSILAFAIFAPKKPEDDAEYETPGIKNVSWSQSEAFEAKNILEKVIFTQTTEKSPNQKVLFAKKDDKDYKISLTN